MKTLQAISLALIEWIVLGGPGQPARAGEESLPPIAVNADGHYLQTSDGRPFFWLGDTAWQLIDVCTREECAYYLQARAEQGFNVIQTTVLSEFDGLNLPDALGNRPFRENDPRQPNERYFDHVLEIVDLAAANHLYVALLPAWGDKLTAPWGAGPRIFTNDNLPVARAYGRYLGEKLKNRTNVVWMLGGDRPANLAGSIAGEYPQAPAVAAGFAADYDWTPIWREIAYGLGDGLGRKPVCLYHPSGGPFSTSVFLRDAPWLSINGIQSGHNGGHDVPIWALIARDAAVTPPKPTLDLEPNYEDHPFNPWPRWDPATGYFDDYDVRKQTYRSVFAGGCGVTYGHHSVWQFASSRREAINHAKMGWTEALYRPGARQMRFLRELVESRPFFDRLRDPSLIAGSSGERGLHMEATRDRAGTFAFIYFPVNDQEVTINLAALSGRTLKAWWFDPRTGIGNLVGLIGGGSAKAFRSPPNGPDWVLVLDDSRSDVPPPGTGRAKD
jgi:hypothetical protein